MLGLAMKGYSLTEFVVVIIILSVIMVIGLPKFYSLNSQSTISALSKIKANTYNSVADKYTKPTLREDNLSSVFQ
ncbi:prepilin-type N-terminal cleavage/methylation domain-containing protein [Vibrio sp. 16]|uniref:prepilin-type N-terminal cleavage/methylation domain-containing protein n=1 Tax=Vibrio sp. 16 TaxID=391586 RepID=UPI00018F2211|nr:Prokaryotic N-terminal methylation motif domain protein [Vibrio sp. 16]